MLKQKGKLKYSYHPSLVRNIIIKTEEMRLHFLRLIHSQNCILLT